MSYNDNIRQSTPGSRLSYVLIPCSFGELFDKYTILQIKNAKIKDSHKLAKINKELQYLEECINQYTMLSSTHKLSQDNITSATSDTRTTNVLSETIINELKNINETLWEIEDKIREKEKKKEFDIEFIELARTVYITNDKRNVIKRSIDNICLSELSDVKSYVDYL